MIKYSNNSLYGGKAGEIVRCMNCHLVYPRNYKACPACIKAYKKDKKK